MGVKVFMIKPRYANFENVQLELELIVKNKKDDFFFVICPDAVVYRSNLNDVNLEYCLANNIRVVDTSNFGGTIVASKFDIGLAIVKKDGNDVGDRLINYLIEKLSSKISNLKISENDILADDKYKIASYASTYIGDNYYYTVAEISLNPNLEHIKNICSKAMVKEPGGLLNWGFKLDEIIKMVQEFIA